MSRASWGGLGATPGYQPRPQYLPRQPPTTSYASQPALTREPARPQNEVVRRPRPRPGAGSAQRTYDQNECPVCFDSLDDTTLRRERFACGHSACEHCARELRALAAGGVGGSSDASAAQPLCPLCRAPLLVVVLPPAPTAKTDLARRAWRQLAGSGGGASGHRPSARPLVVRSRGPAHPSWALASGATAAAGNIATAAQQPSGAAAHRAGLVRPVLVWFRNDLRVADNPALYAAASSGAPVIPVFIHALCEEGPWPMGGAGRYWLHHSLGALQAELRASFCSDLVLRCADADGGSLAQLIALIEETGASACYFNNAYEPWKAERDDLVDAALRSLEIQVRRTISAVLNEPWAVRPDERPAACEADLVFVTFGQGGKPEIDRLLSAHHLLIRRAPPASRDAPFETERGLAALAPAPELRARENAKPKRGGRGSASAGFLICFAGSAAGWVGSAGGAGWVGVGAWAGSDFSFSAQLISRGLSHAHVTRQGQDNSGGAAAVVEVVDWAGGMRAFWGVGEDAAHAALGRFVVDGLKMELVISQNLLDLWLERKPPGRPRSHCANLTQLKKKKRRNLPAILKITPSPVPTPPQLICQQDLSIFVYDSKERHQADHAATVYDSKQRHRADHAATARISPHIRFGELSPRQVWPPPPAAYGADGCVGGGPFYLTNYHVLLMETGSFLPPERQAGRVRRARLPAGSLGGTW
ncbi:hypothetical protein T492DRAFT_832201 [Pavlovales sp. CCMP2436]|nr:hypothetical protein T492DRAFT_832201 [Pavlovales sp. CCMP2436]